MKRYKTDRQFSMLCVQKTAEELEELETDLQLYGCRQPIYVWQGMLIDGHKRYEACRKLKIKYQGQEVGFSDKEEAIIWACRRRLDQLQTGTASGEYIIGKLLMTELKVYKATVLEKMKLADELAERFGITRSTIYKYLHYAKLMDEIAGDEPLLVELALAGKIRFGYGTMNKLMQMDVRERHRMILDLTRDFRKDDNIRVGVKRAEKERLEPLDLHVKDMPEYDPNTEVKGLIFTLPMWMNAMNQMMERTKMELVTDEVKGHLKKSLQELTHQIDSILEEIAE